MALYEFISVLPGVQETPCPAKTVSFNRTTVHGCDDDGQEMLPHLNATLPTIEAFFPELQVALLRISLHRPGSRALKKDWRISRLNDMTVEMSFRYIPGSARHARNAVRVLAHELAHVAYKSRINQTESEEYFAAVAESCVEYSVFRSTTGYAFEADVEGSISDDFDDAQRHSAMEAKRAYRTVREFAGNDGKVHLPNPAFAAFCTATLSPEAA